MRYSRQTQGNTVTLLDVGASGHGRATMLGSDAGLGTLAQGNDLRVNLPPASSLGITRGLSAWIDRHLPVVNMKRYFADAIRATRY